MKKLFSTTLIVAFAVCTLFAQGYYIEMKLTSDKKDFSGDMKLYYQDGNSRSSISMYVPELGSAMDITSLTLAKTPNVVYMLDEKKKTYSEVKTESDEDWKDYPESEYEVTVLGKETVNGYNTTHVNVKRKGSKTDQEMWVTKDMVDYADYAKIKSKYTGKDNMLKAMEAKGVSGFPVRIKTAEQGMAFFIDIVKAEKKSSPADYFTLNGYTKSAGVSGMPGGIDMQQIMQNMQNMTPEQQEQFLKQMEQQYSPR